MSRCFLFLFFLSLLLLVGSFSFVNLQYAQTCNTETWNGGFVINATDDLCSDYQIKGNGPGKCRDSQDWDMTGSECCEYLYSGSYCRSGSVTAIGVGSEYTYTCCTNPTPTPVPPTLTPTNTPVPPTLTPTPTRTPTPTPTPTPSCSSFTAIGCQSCIDAWKDINGDGINDGPSCGWGGVSIYSCRDGTNVCPASYTLWQWVNCSENRCLVPTPTPTRTPTPTLIPPGPTATPTPTIISCPAPSDGSLVAVGGSQWRCMASCGGINHGQLTCLSGSICCEFPLTTPTNTPTPGPTSTPFPAGVCGNALPGGGSSTDSDGMTWDCVSNSNFCVSPPPSGLAGTDRGVRNCDPGICCTYFEPTPAPTAVPGTCYNGGSGDNYCDVGFQSACENPSCAPIGCYQNEYDICITYCASSGRFPDYINRNNINSSDVSGSVSGWCSCLYGNTCGLTPTPTPPSYSISGSIFKDDNKNKTKQGSEENYAEGTSVINIYSGDSCSGALVTTLNTTTGSYNSGSTLPEGKYTVCYGGPPSGYQITYPYRFLNPQYLKATVGSGCDSSTGNPTPVSAVCDAGGNITDLNFGITNSFPWIQSKGRDMRFDAGFDYKVPNLKFMSINGSGGMPGIIFTGTFSPSSSLNYFGAGKASDTPFNWQVGGNLSPRENVYRSNHTKVTTSYEYLLSIGKDYGLTPTDITPQCGREGDIPSLFNCTFPPSPSPIPNGFYIANGDLVLNAYTFPIDKDYVILVNGKLIIQGNIKVPIGSTVTFSVKGDIIVDENVGELPSSLTTNIEGFYTTGNDFIVQGTNDCSIGTDKRLNIGGTVVTNGELNLSLPGQLRLQRDLCASNTTYPAVYFTERLDFILNAPRLIQLTEIIYKEVPPK